MLGDVMFKPFLVDEKWEVTEISLVTSVYGMAFSIAGSLLGGLICRYYPLLDCIEKICVWRTVPHFGRLLLSTHWMELSRWNVLTIVCSESFLSGALTTIVFSLMMSKVMIVKNFVFE